MTAGADREASPALFERGAFARVFDTPGIKAGARRDYLPTTVASLST